MPLKKMPRKLIGEILIEEGLLDPPSLEKALKTQKKEGGLLGEILVRMGIVSEEQVIAGLSKQLSLPFIRLAHYKVNRNAIRLVPKEVAERYLFFPFEEDEKEVSIAVVDPVDPETIEEIGRRISVPFQVFLAELSEIKRAIGTHYRE